MMRLQQVFRQDQIFHSQSLDVDVERIFGDIRQVVPNFFLVGCKNPAMYDKILRVDCGRSYAALMRSLQLSDSLATTWINGFFQIS